MTKAQNVAQPRSLGELFEGLRPGASCPWCGEGLSNPVPSSLDPGVGHQHESPECEEEAVLWCPGCGAEVHGCLCSTDARGDRPLGAAA